MSRRNHLRRCVAAAAALVLAMTLASAADASCTEPHTATARYRQHASDIALGLGASRDYAQTHQWTLQPEAPALTSAGTDVYGRALRLAPHAAAALRTMVVAASRDGVTLQAVSGFRSFAYQRRLLRRKLDRGVPLTAVLEVNALPGFSEHHSGCALDLTTPGVPAADTAFATTPAFAWLAAHADRFGFALSYPQGNARGIDFEPWHWRYVGTAQTAHRAAVTREPTYAHIHAVARPATAPTVASLSIQPYPR
jgi:LAS superfamily LD-carboxypeptidase LdcB